MCDGVCFDEHVIMSVLNCNSMCIGGQRSCCNC